MSNRLQDMQQDNCTFSLENYQTQIDNAFTGLHEKNIISRIWQRDHTVWKSGPEEIANRLGWLDCPETMRGNISEMSEFAENVRTEGFTQALLLGMGGSSLAPEVFQKTFGVKDGYLDLAVLDSTDPGAVLAAERKLDLSKTIFLVSSKSGGTVETMSLFKYFYNRVAQVAGDNRAAKHFTAITDPGSSLEATARAYRFRKIFLNDPDIGGRFSALSYFGLVPAALIGVDLLKLLERAKTMASQCCKDDLKQTENPGARLGVIMGELAKHGRDKVTLILSPKIASFGAWIEQLIAESTGKEGGGVLPVATEPVGPPEVYCSDRLFVSIRYMNDLTHEAAVQNLTAAGHPVLQIDLDEVFALGSEFFKWEFATAVACWKLGVNPFNQPNVESAKARTRKMVAEFREKGELPTTEPTFLEKGIAVYTDIDSDNLAGALQDFLGKAQTENSKPRSYCALQAYIQPTSSNDAALGQLAKSIRDHFRVATTYGYGPRFLHSTGQLHKGDAGNGLFIQITANMAEDIAIPDKAGASASSMTFGVLKMAQALGDRQALLDCGRQVIRFDLGDDVVGGLERLAEMG
ncbi:MAG: glucose-6-phosphate isomerase [bacterium]